ncbi:hypothetical protein VC83_09250 [Pseudogymnoascus destructans]|uniref:Uncharacterized protein n=1 Tax=Pseudogymnoascus destructans TaxID=655981 RepID=A0A176ZZ61_9PEZI|nr:uncharacterized protein VC83_09250 [Pseudogymnoascus destructans]OAF54532.1 hypothetical protein VC83_09250 [Pseudogymnoascus destructans]
MDVLIGFETNAQGKGASVTTEQEGWPTTGQEGGRSHETGPVSVTIPPAVTASVRDLLALQSDFGAAVGGVRVGLRARIVAAAAALPAEVRVAVSVAPSAVETSAALLRNSEETLVVLRQMQRSMAALTAGGRKGKGKKRG